MMEYGMWISTGMSTHTSYNFSLSKLHLAKITISTYSARNNYAHDVAKPIIGGKLSKQQ